MTFQIKSFKSIITGMIKTALASQKKVTDFSVGSVARTMMEAPAIEIEELYLQMLLGLQDAIPVSIYQAFNFQIVDALPAAGQVTIHFDQVLTSDFIFPRGSVLDATDKGLSFYTLEEVTALTGATEVTLAVAASVPGVGGNVSSNEINSFGGQLNISAGATFTHLAFTSGRDAESESERKTRFMFFVSSIARGTLESLRYAASIAVVRNGGGTVQEYVTKIGIAESPGYVRVYIYGSAGVPSVGLLSSAQNIIDGHVDSYGQKVDGYRAAGVEVVVLPMAEHFVDVGISAATIPGVLQTAALSAQIANAASLAVMAVQAGQYLYADSLISAVLSLPGVLSCSLSNTANVLCEQFQVMRPGAITVSWI